MPHLSVVVPTYNRADTLEACLQAVRASTFQDYELIVVDCGSQDATCDIARRYADRLIELQGIPSRSAARNQGIASAQGEIMVNVDSDVVIQPSALARIAEHFAHHPEVDALTGLLSKEHPNPNFFSQYKNLYMHYLHDAFGRLPQGATLAFVYGSIHAVRRQAIRPYGLVVRIADDLELGQQLAAEGKRIAFVRDLEVVHLKRHDALSLIKNDFHIPCDWAVVFIAYKGWKRLGRHGVGFGHARVEQILSIILAPLTALVALVTSHDPSRVSWAVSLAVVWLLLNRRFIAFLAKERGVVFGVRGCVWTFFDHLVMAAGILCGLVTAVLSRGGFYRRTTGDPRQTMPAPRSLLTGH